MAEELKEEARQDGTPPAAGTHHEKATLLPVSSKHQQNGTGGGVDADAQEMVIASLRLQVQDLFSQVNQLNNKLVKSYDRVSDLEDNLHVASSNLRSSSLKISQLELERTQHLSALNTGLLVEKSHVTAELNRLMEKATEEAAQRGQAESARNAIEKDLDELSATLFGQANTMVAEARFAQHLSERKVEDAQNALKGAEEVVGLMQNQMQVLQAEKERADNKSREMELLMGKGKWVQRGEVDLTRSLKLLSSHSPYQEFLLFVAHLRSLHSNSPCPPAMSTLLPLPFLARLLNEDSEPTVRLDLAPSLNWLSRRSVLAAIHAGQLTIEPIPAGTLFQEASSFPTPTNIAGLNSSNDNASCALCGTSVFSTDTTPLRPNRPSPHPMSITNFHSNSATWAAGAFFKRTSSTLNTQPSSPTNSITRTSTTGGTSHQVYIFRLASTSASTISALPLPTLSKSLSSTGSSTPPHHPSGYNGSPSSTVSNNQTTTIYPLCSSGWCLLRLRATCSLWSFVRTGIVEKIWEEEVPTVLPPPSLVPQQVNGEKPPIPPRKRGLWGIASALGEKAASWSDGDKAKGKSSAAATPPNTPPSEPAASEIKKRPLPPPPPSHPSSATGHNIHPSPHAIPPPLPKRNVGRVRVPLESSPSRSEAELRPVTPTQTGPVATTESPKSPTKSQIHSAAPLVPPQRSSTPHSVPLPESRPSTPVNSPARIASPATAGATPPPLPRRAAARGARPALAGAGSSLSRPTTPAAINATTPPVVNPTDAEGEPVNGSVVAAIPTSTEVPVSPEAVSEKQEPSESEKHQPFAGERHAEEVVEKTTTPRPGDAVAESTTAELGKVLDRSIQGSPASDDVFLDAPSEKEANDEPSPTFKPNEEASAVESKPVGSNDLSQVQGISQDHTKDQGEKATIREEERDKETYVGDATWEERTWKELVRLKEDMFWARVGGLR